MVCGDEAGTGIRGEDGNHSPEREGDSPPVHRHPYGLSAAEEGWQDWEGDERPLPSDPEALTEGARTC